MVGIREIGRYTLGTVRFFLLGLTTTIILATLQLLGKNASSNEEL